MITASHFVVMANNVGYACSTVHVCVFVCVYMAAASVRPTIFYLLFFPLSRGGKTQAEGGGWVNTGVAR